jgi:hypothetical protein
MNPSPVFGEKATMSKGAGKSKEVTMRVKDDTLRLINMFAGELQAESGKNISVDTAIREVFTKFRPDLVAKLEKAVDAAAAGTQEKAAS